MSNNTRNRLAPNSIARLLADSADRLVQAGIAREDTGIETRRLLQHATRLRLEDIIAYPERTVNPKAVAAYQAALQRRITREPSAYITGKQRSIGRDFLVDRRVLVPRWETALLIQSANDHLEQHPIDRPRICDLGTGCGILAIHMALDQPNADIIATDISTDALDVARRNAQNHRVDNRITFLQHDMTSPAIATDLGTFDIVLSNPPYVPSARLDGGELDPEVTDWEPRLALDGGPDGMAVLQPLLTRLPTLLKPAPTSAAFIETDHTLAEQCAELARRTGIVARVEIHDDLAHRHRVVAAYRSPP